MGSAHSQETINEFVVKVDETHNPMTIYSSYGATPNDGIVIINSTIQDLEFNIPAAPGRIKTVADKNKNRYILIIQPNDNNYKQYKITINAKGYIQGKIFPVVVKAGFSTSYVVNPKYVARPNNIESLLYVDEWTIYSNGKKLSDHEIRTLFANTPAYEQYEKGWGICKSTFWHKKDRWGLPTINGIAYTLLAGGGVMVIMGYGLAPLEESDGDVNGAVISRKFGAAGLIVTGVSCGLFLIKVGVLASGKAKIRKAVNIYNNQGMYSQSGVKMEYGLTGNGVYFALNF